MSQRYLGKPQWINQPWFPGDSPLFVRLKKQRQWWRIDPGEMAVPHIRTPIEDAAVIGWARLCFLGMFLYVQPKQRLNRRCWTVLICKFPQFPPKLGLGWIKRERQREREREREKERKTDRQAGRETERKKEESRSSGHVWKDNLFCPCGAVNARRTLGV